MKRFPQVLDAIAEGRVHLTGLVELRKCFKPDNVDALLAEMSGKSKRELEELVARLAPKRNVVSRMTLMPEQTVLAAVPVTCGQASVVGAAAEGGGAGVGASGVSVGEAMAAVGRATRGFALALQIQPLTPATYEVRFTASRRLRDKLEELLDLMSHRNPDRDLAPAVEAAADKLLELLKKEKFGVTDRPQQRSRGSKPGHVSNAVRREVISRDGRQCSFVSDDGQRCSARDNLEFDHIEPRAVGGADDATNVRILCRAHNLRAAEKFFGRAHIDERIAFRQRNDAAEMADAGRMAPEAAHERALPAPKESHRESPDAVVRDDAIAPSDREDCVAPPAETRKSRTEAVLRPSFSTETRRRAEYALVRDLGFRAAEVERALAAIAPTHHGRTIEQVVVAALRHLT